jgi:hypothetical protein
VDYIVKLTFLLLLSFNVSATTMAEPFGRFTARNIAALKRAEANALLARVDWNAVNRKTGLTVKHSRLVKFQKNAVARIIKSKAFSPWGLAVQAAIIGAGYLIDSQNNEIMTTGATPDPSVNGDCRTHSGSSVDDPVYQSWNNISYSACAWNASRAPNFLTEFEQSGVIYYYNHDTAAFGGSSPVADDDLIDDVLPKLTETQKKDLFRNDEGEIDFPALDDISSDIKADHDAASDGDPATQPTGSGQFEPTSDPDVFQKDIGVEVDVDVEAPPEPPVLCDKYPDSLACLDVGKPDQTPEVPVVEVPFNYQPFFLSSVESCPAPVAASVMGFNINMTFQPMCDLAYGVRPIILAVGLFIAAGIVAGSVKNGGEL